MTEPAAISFLIDHIDPLGQGVYKNDGQIYFVPKTLPGEKGTARILKSKKNLHFCELIEVVEAGANRASPECPHFESCPGCDFLHTDYSSELDYKAKSFERMAQAIGSPKFEIIAADNRLHYRNRVQLHYSKKTRKLGFIQGKSNRILEVPNCKIFRPELKEAFKNAYENKEKLLKNQKRPKGHLELYYKEKGNKIVTNWNKRYAQGGFSQVNSEMNLKLLAKLEKELSSISVSTCLDLFGGGGNLAEALGPESSVDHIDLYPSGDHENFYNLDLFEEASLRDFSKKTAKEDYDLFIVDPPRAGFKGLSRWAEKFRPKYIVYISCHPATMFRDLKELEGAQVKSLALLDLFPSTRHFEAFCLLKMA